MIKKDTLILPSNEVVDAMVPVIVSASRSTDIPAFYAKWFINRLKAGYVVWVNPFNKQPVYVSFKNTRAIVFWTKNPSPLLPYLDVLDEMGIHYYFQYTINDYEKEGFEPNVVALSKRIDTFKKLSERIGAERVIWRFDPIMMAPSLGIGPREILTKIWNISKSLKGYTNKLVFSFIDVKPYRKVQNNLVKGGVYTKDNVSFAEPSEAERNEIVTGLIKIRERWHELGWDLSLATCAENVDYDSLGIEHNRCIDGELLYKLFGDDAELKSYLESFMPARKQLDLLASLEPSLDLKRMKDKGQRVECGCTESKDIGMYNTCSHNCIYCYANTSAEVVRRNRLTFMEASDSVIPFKRK